MDYSVVSLYFLFVNIVGGLLFAYDKNAAIKNKSRIPERSLHLFELLGGVFGILFLMYSLRHKNRKFSYWIWTWFIFVVWLVVLYFYITLK